jgi:hypothetical protein
MSELRDSQQASLTAIDYLDANGSVVQSGANLADAVLNLLRSGTPVLVNLADLRAVSSSYFNIFLQRVADAVGLSAIGSTIQLQFGTPLQKRVYDRSFAAVAQNERTG